MLNIIITAIFLISNIIHAQDTASSTDSASSDTTIYTLTPSQVLFYDTLTGGSTDAGSWNSNTLEYQAGTAADNTTNLNYTRAQIEAQNQVKDAITSQTTDLTSALATQTTNITGSIEGTTAAVGTEGDETQQTLVTMIGQTNRILEYYLKNTPAMIRKGLYGTEGLNTVKLKAIEQTLPDPVATLVKTQQEISATFNPFNPSGQPPERANIELDKKIRGAFAGMSEIVIPNGASSKNRYEYTARLLSKLLYPVILGGQEAGTNGAVPAMSNIVEITRPGGSLTDGGQISSAFVKPATPENNIAININSETAAGEKDKSALTKALSDDDFKKAAEVYIQLSNLKHRYDNCLKQFQKDTSGPATSAATAGSGSGPDYIIANTTGLKAPCKKDDTQCINISPECGPIMEASNLTGQEKINAKYANGWAQLITDTEATISNSINISTPQDTSEDSETIDNGFVTCSGNGEVKQACQSANLTLATLTRSYQKSLSLKGSGVNKSIYAQNYEQSYTDKSIIKTMKPHVGNFKDGLKDPLNSLYAYLFLKLEQSLMTAETQTAPSATSQSGASAGTKGTTDGSTSLEKANFPSYSNYMQNETYEKASANDPSLLECTDAGGVPKPIITEGKSPDTFSALQYIDSMSKMDGNSSLKIEGIPIPLDWEDGNGNKNQIVLAFGAWVPLTKLKSEGTAELKQFNYKVSDQYYIAGKSPDVTETTYSKRPGFYQSFESSIDTKLSKETSALLGKTTAYSTLIYPYQQRNTKYAFSCKSLTNNANKATRTVYMTPIQAMKQSSSWRLKNTYWRNSVATMDTNNLLREMLFLLAEMRQMQFEQYLQLQKGTTLSAAQVASASAGASAMDGLMGGSNDAENYLVGRKQSSMPGPAADAASNATDTASAAMGSMDASGALGNSIGSTGAPS